MTVGAHLVDIEAVDAASDPPFAEQYWNGRERPEERARIVHGAAKTWTLSIALRRNGGVP